MIKINGEPITAANGVARKGDIVTISDIDNPLFMNADEATILIGDNVRTTISINGSRNVIKGGDAVRIVTSGGYNSIVSVGDNCHIGGTMNGAMIVAGKRCAISLKGGGNLVTTLDRADVAVDDECLVFVACDSKVITGNRSTVKAFTSSSIDTGDESLVSVHGGSSIAANRNCTVSILNESQGPTKVNANVGSIATCLGVSHEFKMKHHVLFEGGEFTSKRKYSVGKRSITLTEEEFLQIMEQRNES